MSCLRRFALDFGATEQSPPFSARSSMMKGRILCLRKSSVRTLSFCHVTAPASGVNELKASIAMWGNRGRRTGCRVRAADLVQLRAQPARVDPVFERLASGARRNGTRCGGAAALAAGRTIAEYAEEAQVTQGTARWQLKQLFTRADTNRPTALIPLLLSGAAQPPPPVRWSIESVILWTAAEPFAGFRDKGCPYLPYGRRQDRPVIGMREHHQRSLKREIITTIASTYNEEEQECFVS